MENQLLQKVGKMLNEGVKRAWDSYIAAGEGAEGFTAATNTFPRC
jgi:hypothetical protein